MPVAVTVGLSTLGASPHTKMSRVLSRVIHESDMLRMSHFARPLLGLRPRSGRGGLFSPAEEDPAPRRPARMGESLPTSVLLGRIAIQSFWCHWAADRLLSSEKAEKSAPLDGHATLRRRLLAVPRTPMRLGHSPPCSEDGCSPGSPLQVLAGVFVPIACQGSRAVRA